MNRPARPSAVGTPTPARRSPQRTALIGRATLAGKATLVGKAKLAGRVMLVGTALLAAGTLLAGCTGAAKPKPTPHSPAASAEPSFAGPGSFHLSWDFSSFGTGPCTPEHPKGPCVDGSANGTLPLIGHVDLTRFGYGADDSVKALAGCVAVVTEGTLKRPDGGMIKFHAPGQVCGDVTTYTVDRSTGSGPLAGYTLAAFVRNSGGSEVWSGKVTGPA